METTLGQILMNVDGADKDYTVETLLGNAMLHDLSFDASESNIVELSETADETRRRKSAEWRAEQKQKEIADANRKARRAPVTGAFGKKGFVALTPKRKGTTVTVTPEHTVDRETGELKATDASTFRRNKMSKMEFDGVKDVHAKRKACGCNPCKQYRTQAWQFMSKQKDESGELIRTEHPDAKAVKCTV